MSDEQGAPSADGDADPEAHPDPRAQAGERAPGGPSISSQRVLIVGASKGIGRATALAFARSGAAVAVSARDAALLDDLAATAAGEGGEAGGAVHPLPADVRDPDAVDGLVLAALDRLGGLDAVVYATGVNHLGFLADTDTARWAAVLETNVVGAALVTQAALPALRPGGGRIAFLSSHSVADPWPGLGAYVASKAALDSMIATWRLEEPDVAFTRVVVGPTITGMAEDWDPDLSTRMFERWYAEGRFDGIEPVLPEVVADVLVSWATTAVPPLDVHLLDP